MIARQQVRDIAAALPLRLKQMRGKLMLEALCETLGVEEVTCPACAGTGWLDMGALESCPICCGFLEVPDRLAEWFKAQLRRREEEPAAGTPRHRAEVVTGSVRERYGRLAEVLYRVHVGQQG